jgi:hypothetical protein
MDLQGFPLLSQWLFVEISEKQIAGLILSARLEDLMSGTGDPGAPRTK